MERRPRGVRNPKLRGCARGLLHKEGLPLKFGLALRGDVSNRTQHLPGIRNLRGYPLTLHKRGIHRKHPPDAFRSSLGHTKGGIAGGGTLSHTETQREHPPQAGFCGIQSFAPGVHKGKSTGGENFLVMDTVLEHEKIRRMEVLWTFDHFLPGTGRNCTPPSEIKVNFERCCHRTCRPSGTRGNRG